MSAAPTVSTAPRVFIAEDSAPMRSRIARLLGSSAQVVGEGATPDHCIDAILHARPDVVVLDVQLQGGQGLEVLLEVRARAPRIAFVVFSNQSHPTYRKRYLEAGAASFLDKSTEFEQLAAAVAAAPGASSDLSSNFH